MHAVVDETSIVLFSTGKKYHTVSIAGNKIIDSVWGLTHWLALFHTYHPCDSFIQRFSHFIPRSLWRESQIWVTVACQLIVSVSEDSEVTIKPPEIAPAHSVVMNRVYT